MPPTLVTGDVPPEGDAFVNVSNRTGFHLWPDCRLVYHLAMIQSAVNVAQRKQFELDGYVVLHGLLDVQQDIQPVVDEYSQLLDDLVQRWSSEGRLNSTYPSLPFCQRLSRVVVQAEAAYDQYFDISLPQADIQADTPMHHGAAVFGLLRNPRLLDAVEQFVGPEILSNPVQHTRIKLPERQLSEPTRTGLTAQVAWHQDLAVVTEEADATELLTVWIPITPATVANGCLAVVPGSHRRGLSLHCRSRNELTLNQVSIPDSRMTDAWRPLPMKPGDVLMMHRKTKHCGLPNRSDEVRWSFDLRYQPTHQPTGRPWFPSFVARSRAHPETELTCAATWAQMWRETRSQLAASDEPTFNRWQQGDPRCA